MWLEQAVDAYRNALEVHTRERDALGWARTQNNLGIGLAALGELKGDTAHLKQAVKACRAAGTVFTVEDLPQ